jgi:hypothetical protein
MTARLMYMLPPRAVTEGRGRFAATSLIGGVYMLV